mgnify:CR=1 FL=1
MTNEIDNVEKQWNEHAEYWNQLIGDDGDATRKERNQATFVFGNMLEM